MEPAIRNTLEKELGNCLNCGSVLRDQYCGQCGQKASTHRFTWHEIGHGTVHTLLHLDSGIFFTLQELATRPGHAIREYLEGKRERHFNAFPLLLTLTAICSFIYVHFHIETYLASVRLNDLEETSPMIVHKYFAIRSVVFVLLCAAGDSLMFRDRGYAYPELVVSNTYIFSAVSAIQVICSPLFLVLEHTLPGAVLRGLVLTGVIGYLIWVRRQFYRAGSDIRQNLRIVLLVLMLFGIVVAMGRLLVKPYLESLLR